MSYAPGNVNRVGEIFSQALSEGYGNFQQSFAAAQQRRDENDFLTGTLDQMAKARAATGNPIDPDTLEKFHSGNIGVKRGIVSELGTDQARQLKTMQIQQQQAQLDQQAGDQTVFQKLIGAGGDEGAGAQQAPAPTADGAARFMNDDGQSALGPEPEGAGTAQMPGGDTPNQPLPGAGMMGGAPTALRPYPASAFDAPANGPVPTADGAAGLMGNAAAASAPAPISSKLLGRLMPADVQAAVRGVKAVSPNGMRMLQEAKFTADANQAEDTLGRPLKLEDLETIARRVGVPFSDQLTLTREKLNEARAAREESRAAAADRAGKEPSVVDEKELYPGIKAVMLRGSKQMQVITDPRTGMHTEQVPDADGNMHTLIRNPKTGAGVFVPNTNTAQANKVTVETMVEAEKAIRGIDDDISAYQYQLKRSQADKTKTAPDPAVLKDLQARRGRLQGAVDGAKPAGGAKAAPTATSTPPGTVPAEVQSLYDGANTAIRQGADPAKVRARLAAKLHDMGFQQQE